MYAIFRSAAVSINCILFRILNKIGGLYCTAELLILNHAYCRAKDENKSYLLRQWASLTLTNLTFQEPSNKVLFLVAIVVFLLIFMVF